MKLGAAMEWLEDQGFLPGRREIREREREFKKEKILEVFINFSEQTNSDFIYIYMFSIKE